MKRRSFLSFLCLAPAAVAGAKAVQAASVRPEQFKLPPGVTGVSVGPGIYTSATSCHTHTLSGGIADPGHCHMWSGHPLYQSLFISKGV